MVFTLCLVMAPTMRGHTIPDNVPTPFEMPISMLAYRGAISKWLTLNPEWNNKNSAQTYFFLHCFWSNFWVRLRRKTQQQSKLKSSRGEIYCCNFNHLGTKSLSLSFLPEIANPLKPTARTRKEMATPFEWEYPTTSRRVASIPKPETRPRKHINN